LNSLLQKLVEAWRNRATSAKVASFALVAVVNTLIDVNVFAIAYAIFGIPVCTENLNPDVVMVKSTKYRV
jgi:hypothetical protein